MAGRNGKCTSCFNMKTRVFNEQSEITEKFDLAPIKRRIRSEGGCRIYWCDEGRWEKDIYLTFYKVKSFKACKFINH